MDREGSARPRCCSVPTSSAEAPSSTSSRCHRVTRVRRVGQGEVWLDLTRFADGAAWARIHSPLRRPLEVRLPAMDCGLGSRAHRFIGVVRLARSGPVSRACEADEQYADDAGIGPIHCQRSVRSSTPGSVSMRRSLLHMSCTRRRTRVVALGARDAWVRVVIALANQASAIEVARHPRLVSYGEVSRALAVVLHITAARRTMKKNSGPGVRRSLRVPASSGGGVRRVVGRGRAIEGPGLGARTPRRARGPGGGAVLDRTGLEGRWGWSRENGRREWNGRGDWI